MNRPIKTLFVLLLIGFSALAKNETVKEVVAKKSEYLNTEFKLKGIIHEPDSSLSKDSYILVDRSNDSIEIRLEDDEESLEVGSEYRFEGKLKEKDEQLYYLVNDQECLDCEDEESESNTMLFILSAAVVIFGVVIIYLINRQKTNNNIPPSNPFPSNPQSGGFNPNPNPNQGFGNNPTPPAGNQASGGTDNFATIAFNPNQLPKQPVTESKTVVMNQPKPEADNKIPGSFNFTLKGEEKSISLKGFPTGLGHIATVGREAVENEKADSHLHLADQTVSRKQAEFIFESGNLYIRNLSSTNPSQLNGKTLGSGELDQVHSGAKLKFGEVIVSYQA